MSLDSTKSCLPYTERSYSNDRRSRDTVGSCSASEHWVGSLTGVCGRPRISLGTTVACCRSLEAREHEDSVGLLSPPSSQPSRGTSLLDPHNGSSTFFARISVTFHSRSRLRNTSSASASGSGGSSRHNSPVSVSSVSLALGRARAHSLIQGIGGALRSIIELVLATTSAVRGGAPRYV
jgi:hypothetical protein